MLGASFLLGGLKHHTQEFNRVNARLQAGLLFLATIALLIPSAVSQVDSAPAAAFTQQLSVGLSVLLIVGYGWACSSRSRRTASCLPARTHGARRRDRRGRWAWRLPRWRASRCWSRWSAKSSSSRCSRRRRDLGMTPAFVGFIVVALVGGAAEMVSAFSGARKNRLDLSVGIALGSASQIALFVAPVLVLLSYFIGPTPMDLQFWPGAVVMMLIATLTAALVTNSGRSAWFVGVLVLMVYLIFAMTLYLLPPRVQ